MRRPFQVQYSEPSRFADPRIACELAQEREDAWWTQCTHGDADGAVECCRHLRWSWRHYGGVFLFRVRNRDTGEIVWPEQVE